MNEAMSRTKALFMLSMLLLIASAARSLYEAKKKMVTVLAMMLYGNH
jgi:hypothetical protein